MAPRSSTLLLSSGLALAVSSCVTVPEAPPAPAAKAQTAAEAEVVVLRERVGRLEKRLADVDGKLSLLLARAEGAPVPTQKLARAMPTTTPVPAPVSYDLGTKSIDLSRGGDVPLDDDGEIVLRMHGDDAPIVSHNGGADDISDDDDPLTALRNAKDLYAWGQARLKEARYVEAVAAFEDVLGRFPTHDLADNSAYWVGHCHAARGEHRLAIAEWQKLPQKFPRSDKIADALFGMAQSHEALGEPVVAEVLYDELISSYPKAEKHKEAKKALSRLRPQR